MSEATKNGPGDGVNEDSTLSILVPKQSRRRNAVVGFLAVALLLTVALSPKVLRPAIADGGAAIANSSKESKVVVTAMRITGETEPWLEIASVDQLPGARVKGAWLLPDSALNNQFHDSMSSYDTPDDFVAAQFSAARLEEHTLPQRLFSDESMWLVVAWQVTDCAVLSKRSEMSVRARSVVRLGSTGTVPMLVGGLAGLADGICLQERPNEG